LAQIDDTDMERRDALRPDDAFVVMAGFDNRTNQAADADTVAARLRILFYLD